jgi:hypothetical protein
MIKITIPDLRKNEHAYVLDFVFKDSLGLNYFLELIMNIVLISLME